VAYIGCKYANGDASGSGGINDAAVKDIYSDFVANAANGVANVSGTNMTYWGKQATSAGIPATQVQYLLANEDGRCGAWAGLLDYILKFQGLTSSVKNLEPILPATYVDGYGYTITYDQNYSELYVKNTDMSVRPPNENVPVGISGQGNPNPKKDFLNHALILYNNLLYDPSYGTTCGNTGGGFPSLDAWAQQSIAGFSYLYTATDRNGNFAGVNTVYTVYGSNAKTEFY
jgi:hypothetical protein